MTQRRPDLFFTKQNWLLVISFRSVPSSGFCESLHSNLAAHVPWEPLSLEPGGPRVLILRVPQVSRTPPGVPTHLRGGVHLGRRAAHGLGLTEAPRSLTLPPTPPTQAAPPVRSQGRVATQRAALQHARGGALGPVRVPIGSQSCLSDGAQRPPAGTFRPLLWRESAAGVR